MGYEGVWFVTCIIAVRYCGVVCFFFQAEDGIRDLVRSRGLGDVYKRQVLGGPAAQQHRHLVEQLVARHEEAVLGGALDGVALSLIHI